MDQIAEMREILRQIRRTAEMSASIMRDTRRTGAWEGAEKVARQFDRIATLARSNGPSDWAEAWLIRAQQANEGK